MYYSVGSMVWVTHIAAGVTEAEVGCRTATVEQADREVLGVVQVADNCLEFVPGVR